MDFHVDYVKPERVFHNEGDEERLPGEVIDTLSVSLNVSVSQFSGNKDGLRVAYHSQDGSFWTIGYIYIVRAQDDPSNKMLYNVRYRSEQGGVFFSNLVSAISYMFEVAFVGGVKSDHSV